MMPAATCSRQPIGFLWVTSKAAASATCGWPMRVSASRRCGCRRADTPRMRGRCWRAPASRSASAAGRRCRRARPAGREVLRHRAQPGAGESRGPRRRHGQVAQAQLGNPHRAPEPAARVLQRRRAGARARMVRRAREQLRRMGYGPFRGEIRDRGGEQSARASVEPVPSSGGADGDGARRRGDRAALLFYVHWLALRDIRTRASVPGATQLQQCRAGAGARDRGSLVRMAARLGLQGLAFQPQPIMLTFRQRETMRFVDPARQGRFEALRPRAVQGDAAGHRGDARGGRRSGLDARSAGGSRRDGEGR